MSGLRQTVMAGMVVLTSCASPSTSANPADGSQTTGVTLYEGARLITGTDEPAIEDSAFIVDGSRIGRVGVRGEIARPAGAARVNLSGKTVMPALVSAHMHVGFLDGSDFGPQHYTRDTLVEHLQRYAYYGVGAVFSAGTDVGPLSFEIARQPPPDAARLLTAGRGLATPDGGPGFQSIAHTSYPITSADEARQRVRELAAQGASAVKIWVDDRNGRVKKLPPDIYAPAIQEAHARGMMALAHVYYLRDAHDLVDAGIDGFMHLVRDEVMDDELIAKMKAGNVFATANLGGSRRATVSELPAATLALLAETVPADVVQRFEAALKGRDPKALATARDTYGKMEQSLARLHKAGITLALGGDTGIPNAWHGWAEQYELEAMVAAGMSPSQVLVASTSVPARLLKLADMGTVAPGKSADFVVLDANPLEAIANTQRIAAVYLRGTPLDRAALRRQWIQPQ